MATLNAFARTGSGKGVARKLRASGKVPAVVYGHGDRTTPLAVDAHELELLLGSISVENTVIGLTVEGGSRTDVLIRDVQMHPFKPQALHVDFLQLHADEAIHVRIPVRLNGTPRGVIEDNGVLDQVLYELEVECLPGAIPDVVEVDVSALGLGESARVADVTLPNVKVLADAELPIASVVAPTAAATEPGEAPEPDVIRGGSSDVGKEA